VPDHAVSAKELTVRVEKNKMLHQITVDVKCSWSDRPPVYRLYVDNELMTERTFAWPGYQVFIKENLICDLEAGKHFIKLENCSSTGFFELENLCIENISQVKDQKIDSESWFFSV
jgi:hypothetical protein